MKMLEVTGLSKKYRISHAHGYETLVETLSRCFRKKTDEEFWALKEVSFQLERGDRLGIVGQNGAGKSTLLKLISRITEPTAGRIKICGNVASLLEVGTGFHPELTGRENIFLNGAILGMSRKQILQKFDEIVAFAEVERFLDTPVKRFSSGMITRLGFAVAAHLDPDLLIVDEVLAVGDIRFQEKCLRKLNTIGEEGRTVLFVSHNINTLLSLCNKGLYLESGEVAAFGDLDVCIQRYRQAFGSCGFSWEGEVGDEFVRFERATLGKEYFYKRETVPLAIDYHLLRPHTEMFMEISVWNQREQLLARTTTAQHQFFQEPGSHRLTFPIDTTLFHEGEYQVRINCHIHNLKKVLKKEIALRLPIYSRQQSQGMQQVGKEGMHLGDQWQLVGR